MSNEDSRAMLLSYGDTHMRLTAYSPTEMALFRAIVFYNATISHMSASEWVVRHVIDGLPITLTPDMAELVADLRKYPENEDEINALHKRADELCCRYRRLGRALRG